MSFTPEELTAEGAPDEPDAAEDAAATAWLRRIRQEIAREILQDLARRIEEQRL